MSEGGIFQAKLARIARRDREAMSPHMVAAHGGLFEIAEAAEARMIVSNSRCDVPDRHCRA
jgi:hypothetical protein